MSPRRARELSPAKRGAIIALHEAKKRHRQIAKQVGGISISTVTRTLQRAENHHTTKSLPRSGRPRAVSPRTGRAIIRAVKADRVKPFRAVAENVAGVTERQLGRVANHAGYHRRVARRKPNLTEEQAEKRLHWAHTNTKRDWDAVAWTDEVQIETGYRPGRQRVTRRVGEENLKECIVPTFRSGRKTLMLWGCIANGWKGPIVRLQIEPKSKRQGGGGRGGGFNGAGYAAQIVLGPLKDSVATLKQERGREILVVEDGAPAHKGKAPDDAREAARIQRLAHPPNSPDLNPIEPVWLLLKNRVHDIPGSGRSLEALWAAVQSAWEGITIEDINKHTGKMKERVAAVKEANGWHTEF